MGKRCISNVGPNRHFSCIHAVPIPMLTALAGDSNCTGGSAIRNAGGVQVLRLRPGSSHRELSRCSIRACLNSLARKAGTGGNTGCASPPCGRCHASPWHCHRGKRSRRSRRAESSTSGRYRAEDGRGKRGGYGAMGGSVCCAREMVPVLFAVHGRPRFRAVAASALKIGAAHGDAIKRRG
ncbi:hypothetical protein B0H14DRAFT_1167113 [Mycena olivaceomarginata]|nr:hypothetical protein B0H14DRAFT_1167113 [Mycena olivaceomarginata]